MKLSNKILLSILIAAIILISIILVFVTFAMISFDKDISNDKLENYLEEKNNTIIASGMDGYIFKINENVLFYTLNEKIEIMKTDLTYKNDYSELVANSEVIFTLNNPEESYYLIDNEKFYIRNKNINKFIDLETFEVYDCTDEINGDWVVFQET